jgi:hypothetical protein
MTCAVCGVRDVRRIQGTMKIADGRKPGPHTNSSHALPTAIHLQKCQQPLSQILIFSSRPEVRTGKIQTVSLHTIKTRRGGRDRSMRHEPWH